MKIKLGIFFGGKSVEHEVSIITAIQAIENLDKSRYEIIPIYIAKDNKMYTGKYIAEIERYKDIDKLLSVSKQITLAQKNGKVVLINCNKKLYEKEIINNVDIAFPIVHGTNVEDGTIQGFLKMFNLPYVGCDVISSAIGMDKYACKCILKENKIPVINGKCYTIKDYNENMTGIFTEIENEIKYPVIVKPVNLGSSVGIGIAKKREELEERIDEAFEYSQKILIEKAIINLKEVNCSVLGDFENAETSECEEPIKTEEILSYKDKYISGNKIGSKVGNNTMNAGGLKLPAEITDERKKEIEELAKKVFKVLGCSGVIRIDFIIDKDEDKVFVNEVNTIPGSLSFYLWREIGKNYTELLDNIIELALKRNREENQIMYSFDTNILSSISLKGMKLNK